MITLDIIGVMYSALVLDSDGEIMSGGEPLAGWHVNTIPAVPEWKAYRITPTAKRQVFAGLITETCCYVFPDEAAFTAEAKALDLLPESADEAL